MTATASTPSATSLSAFLTLDAVRIDLDVQSLKRLFEEAGFALENAYGIPHDDAFSALNARERLGSTAVGSGCALPHGRMEGVSAPAVVFLRTRAPLKVPSPDGSGAQLFIAIIVPADEAEAHLELLRAAAGLFSDASARAALLAAETPLAVCEFIASREAA